MKNKWLVALLTIVTGFIFFSFNNNTKASASYWHDGAPEFLSEDSYYNDYGGEATFNNDSMYLNSSQNSLTGSSLFYHKAGHNVYYLATYSDSTDSDGNDQEYTYYLKVKKLNSDQIKVYLCDSNDDPNANYDSWGIFSHDNAN